MQAGWSVAVLMVVMGGLGVSGVGNQERPTAVAWAIAAILIASGAALFLRRGITFYVANAAALLLALSGVAGLVGHRELAMPMPPVLSLVIGLYLILRLMMARKSLTEPSGRVPSG